MTFNHKRLLHVGLNERQAAVLEKTLFNGPTTLKERIRAGLSTRQAVALDGAWTVTELIPAGFSRPQARLLFWLWD